MKQDYLLQIFEERNDGSLDQCGHRVIGWHAVSKFQIYFGGGAYGHS